MVRLFCIPLYETIVVNILSDIANARALWLQPLITSCILVLQRILRPRWTVCPLCWTWCEQGVGKDVLWGGRHIELRYYGTLKVWKRRPRWLGEQIYFQIRECWKRSCCRCVRVWSLGMLGDDHFQIGGNWFCVARCTSRSVASYRMLEKETKSCL